MLIILGGLPATGKTTIARALAWQIAAVHVRVDTIEQNIGASAGPGFEVGPAGYMVAYGIAEDNLTLRNIVVADSVNSLSITREAWLSVARRAGVQAIGIEIVCSDKAEHRRRAEARVTDVDGLIKPTWQEILGRQYEAWNNCALAYDTAKTSVEEIVNNLISKLELEHRLAGL
jgi:predicted kinase